MNVITYVKDTTKFIEELEQLAPQYIVTDEETGDKSWTIQTTPVVKSDVGSLAMSILDSQELEFIESMTTITNLGTYTELFANEESHALYKSVYDYETPITYIDEDGVEQSYMRPKKIGEFAS